MEAWGGYGIRARSRQPHETVSPRWDEREGEEEAKNYQNGVWNPTDGVGELIGAASRMLEEGNKRLSTAESRTREGSRDCMEFRVPEMLGRGHLEPVEAEARMLGYKIKNSEERGGGDVVTAAGVGEGALRTPSGSR